MLRKEKDRDTNGFYKFVRERERERGPEGIMTKFRGKSEELKG